MLSTGPPYSGKMQHGCIHQLGPHNDALLSRPFRMAGKQRQHWHVGLFDNPHIPRRHNDCLDDDVFRHPSIEPGDGDQVSRSQTIEIKEGSGFGGAVSGQNHVAETSCRSRPGPVGNPAIDDRQIDTLPDHLFEPDGRYFESADRDSQPLSGCVDMSPGRKANIAGSGGGGREQPGHRDDERENERLHPKGIGRTARSS